MVRRKYRGSVLGRETELVIDGFTRSGATFALYAFHLSQRRPVRRDRLVLADFALATNDSVRVILDVNRRFGSDFEPFAHTAENVARLFQLIEDRSRRPPWASAVGGFENGEIGPEEYEGAVAAAGGRGLLASAVETRVARPSAECEAMKKRIRDLSSGNSRSWPGHAGTYWDLEPDRL